MIHRRFGTSAPVLLVMFFGFAIHGCGGGGGGGGDSGPPANRAPTAAAQSSPPAAYSSQTVTLDGSASRDEDGTLTTFQWAQIGGPAVPIADANTARASIKAPPVSARTSLRFRVTVTDNGGGNAAAEVALTVDPASVEFAVERTSPRPFVVDDETASLRRTPALFQGAAVTPTAVAWSSDLEGPLGDSPDDLAANLRAGTHVISAVADFGELGIVEKTTTLRVLPRTTTPTAFQASPATGHSKRVRVLAIAFVPTVDGDRIDDTVVELRRPGEWSSGKVADLQAYISTLTTRVKFMLEEGSRYRGYKNASSVPYLGYELVAQYNFYEAFKEGEPYPTNPTVESYADMDDVLRRIPLQQLVEQQGVNEVWLWGYENPKAIMSESNMASPTSGDVSNSFRRPDDLPIFNRTYVVYGYNYHRTQAEAVHNHGHQLEAMLSHVNQIRDANTELFWRDFVGLQSGAFVPGRCGATHFPLNATADYDYNNVTNTVQSDCEDWRPSGGLKRTVGLTNWADVAYAWPSTGAIAQKNESQWYVYWMQNLPGAGNQIPYGNTTMENWWDLVADWDEALAGGKALYKSIPVSSLQVSPDRVVAFVGERTSLAAFDSGSPVPGIAWTSGNNAVATVDATGEVAATGVGSTTVVARRNNLQVVVPITVTAEPTTAADLRAHFPYVAANGSFRVASDIAPAFSNQHLDHLLKVWQLFSGIFARTPGTFTEVYYTRDFTSLYARAAVLCPTIVIPGARNVTACFDQARQAYIWFVVPYIEPDFGTQLHEISHSYLYFTQFDSANWPWFNEGIAMYWESGAFAANGTYAVAAPLGYLTQHFRQWSNAGQLLPLATLTALDRNQFYTSEPTKVYAQSGMLLYYLFKQHPQVMQSVIQGINAGTIVSNAGVLAAIQQQTGLSLAQLDLAYTQYALQF